MTITPARGLRLAFLARSCRKECGHLMETDSRLFGAALPAQESQAIAAKFLLAGRLVAFVARFGRLQDTVGDKLKPSLSVASAEPAGPAIDNLDKAEKFGWIDSTDVQREMRRLRDQMVHWYIEDLVVLASAPLSGYAFAPSMVQTALGGVAEAERVLAM